MVPPCPVGHGEQCGSVFPSQRLSSPPLLPLLALSFQTLRSPPSRAPCHPPPPAGSCVSTSGRLRVLQLLCVVLGLLQRRALPTPSHSVAQPAFGRLCVAIGGPSEGPPSLCPLLSTHLRLRISGEHAWQRTHPGAHSHAQAHGPAVHAGWRRVAAPDPRPHLQPPCIRPSRQ